MVVSTATEAVSNARSWSTCKVGMCLWSVQEWCESPHLYPDASSQWRAARNRHAGDQTPPFGFPVFWTGGGSGFGHVAISVGGGRVRSTDQLSNGKVAEVTLAHIKSKWGNLHYEGWTEDIGGVRLPYAPGEVGPPGPTNPNGVAVGDLVYVIANGALNGRKTPGGALTGTSRAYGERFTVTALDKGWAAE